MNDDIREPERNFVAYRREKGVSDVCGACGQDTGWNIYWSKYGPVSLPVMTNDLQPLLTGGGGVATVSMCCKNCGHIVLFDKRMFNQWEQENGRVPED